jgi:hypothetical protein
LLLRAFLKTRTFPIISISPWLRESHLPYFLILLSTNLVIQKDTHSVTPTEKRKKREKKIGFPLLLLPFFPDEEPLDLATIRGNQSINSQIPQEQTPTNLDTSLFSRKIRGRKPNPKSEKKI